MTEIHVARRRTNPWPWLLGLLVLALLIWLLVGSLGDAPEPSATGEGTTKGAASEARPPERPPLPPVPVADAGSRSAPWTTGTASAQRAG